MQTSKLDLMQAKINRLVDEITALKAEIGPLKDKVVTLEAETKERRAAETFPRDKYVHDSKHIYRLKQQVREHEEHLSLLHTAANR